MKWTVSLQTTDSELMEKVAAQDDRGAFGELYKRYRNAIFSYMRSRLSSVSRAEELTQEVFLKAYRARGTYKPNGKFSAWLWTIARHITIDEFRAQVPEVLEPAREENEASWIENQPADIVLAETRLIEAAEQGRVQKCIDSLAPSQKEALLLRTISEMPYEEIAATLSTSVSAVKSLLFRAKAALVQCIQGGISSEPA